MATYTASTPITSLALDAPGAHLALGLNDGQVQLLHINNANFGKVIGNWLGHAEPVISLAFSQNGRFLASGSWDSTIRLWDVETGQSAILAEHRRGVSALRFSQNGRFLASGSYDDTVIIWDLSLQTWRDAALNYK